MAILQAKHIILSPVLENSKTAGEYHEYNVITDIRVHYGLCSHPNAGKPLQLSGYML